MKIPHLSILAPLLLLSPSAWPQSASPITTFLAPWGGGYSRPLWMTPDGEWLAFVETIGGSCSVSQRISMIRTDGTGYRVVVDTPTIQALKEGTNTGVDHLRLAGDAGTIAFRMPYTVDPNSCDSVPPIRTFLVDVATGVIVEPIINHQPIADVTFTDDGTKMAFRAYEPALSNWSFFLSNIDGTELRKIVDPQPGYFLASGVISGDGSRFVYVQWQGGYNGDVYLYDFATQTTTKLSPITESSIFGVDLSYDGSRIVYSNGPIHAVEADGSGYHLLPASVWFFETVTLTRDGERVYFNGSSTQNFRINWDGTGLEAVSAAYAGAGDRLPVNEDGSLYAHISVLFLYAPVVVKSFETPRLWSYGYETPGSTMTFDVGGNPDDTYYVAGSLALGTLDFPPFGTAGLDPPSLFLVGSGTVDSGAAGQPPFSVGTTTVTVPSSPAVVGLSAYFQALVVEGPGSGSFSNVTTVRIHD